MSQRIRSFWSAFGLGAASVLGAALLWQVASAPPPAYGQIPDAGQQRHDMVAELKQSNDKLERIAKLLEEIRDLNKEGPRDSKATGPERPAKPG